jgi:hypothetical protein
MAYSSARLPLRLDVIERLARELADKQLPPFTAEEVRFLRATFGTLKQTEAPTPAASRSSAQDRKADTSSPPQACFND